MKYCDLTFSTPEENLACDEALLDCAEADADEAQGGLAETGVLRVWESTRYFVALGYGKTFSKEVNIEYCGRNKIPILRRCTGGGTVLQGPGVLNYALIQPIKVDGHLETIASTNHFIMQTHRIALSRMMQAPVEVRGHTDLAIGGLKFSGNAQRRKRHCLLFHGSFLLHLDLDIMEHALPQPALKPAYRMDRSHREFLINLEVNPKAITHTLREAWKADDLLQTIPHDRIETLVREKYSSEQWNARM